MQLYKARTDLNIWLSHEPINKCINIEKFLLFVMIVRFVWKTFFCRLFYFISGALIFFTASVFWIYNEALSCKSHATKMQLNGMSSEIELAVRTMLISSTKVKSCTIFIAWELRAIYWGTGGDAFARKQLCLRLDMVSRLICYWILVCLWKLLFALLKTDDIS